MEENGQKFNIVIVDDEPIITSSLKTLLSLEGGYTPIFFNSPLQALEYIKKSQIDLVISDFLMPEMNGIEFLAEIKKIHAGASLVLLTGYADKESAIKAINEIGLYRYIEKPWNNDDLLLCIKNGLERSSLIEKCEMERLREDFIATLTHDLRTPLHATIQTLEFFLDGTLGELPEKQKILLETMSASNQDMLGLVNALLEVYKYESGEIVLCKDSFDLSSLVNQCVQEIQPLAKKKNIEINICNLNGNKIYADRQEIKRVIANLLGNAVTYISSGAKINILVENGYNSKIITVEDNGNGISPEDAAKLFRRFSQGTSKKRSCGTGLGLYLSRQIVEAHGGKIWLESLPGLGSKFKFSIPDIKKE